MRPRLTFFGGRSFKLRCSGLFFDQKSLIKKGAGKRFCFASCSLSCRPCGQPVKTYQPSEHSEACMHIQRMPIYIIIRPLRLAAYFISAPPFRIRLLSWIYGHYKDDGAACQAPSASFYILHKFLRLLWSSSASEKTEMSEMTKLSMAVRKHIKSL